MIREATLAGSFSPAVLAIGAAAVTGVIAVGVIAGPGTIACVERGDFGQCMSETFLGTEPEMVAGVGATTGQPVTEPETATPEIVAEEPEVAASAEPEPEPAPPAVKPSFDVVRVEPDGSAVMAGAASPGGDIQIFANDDLIGEETAEPSGDWVFVTDEPLPTGGVELRVFDMTSEQFAETSVVVVVEDDRTSEPLVVASTPGEASDVLQGLRSAEPSAGDVQQTGVDDSVGATSEPVQDEAPEPAEGEAEAMEGAVEDAAPEDIAVTEADPVAVPAEEPAVEVSEPAEAEAAVEAVSIPEVEGAEPEAAAVDDIDEAAVEAPAADEAVPTEPAEPEADATAEVTEVADAETDAQVEEQATTPDGPAAEPASQDASDAVVAESASEEVVANAEPAVSEVAPAEPAITIAPPTIDAVEIDGDRNFFAGSGADGFAVRLYVDNSAVGTTTVADGRWLIEAANVLTGDSHRIRIDMLNPDGTVVGRAEVNFVVDLLPPEPAEPLSQETQSEEPQSEEPSVAVAGAPASESVDPAAQSQGQAPLAEEAGQPSVTAEESVADVEPVQPAAAETAAEESVPTLVGVSDGDRVVSGQAIIRRGDNLWTIARRVYGEGIRYTQIYQANTDQIRDPDLIYPGQVFTLPGTDMQIGGEAETE